MVFWRKKKDEDTSEASVEEKQEVQPVQEVQVKEEAEPSLEPVEEAEEQVGWFSRLSRGLSRSSNKLSQGINDIFTKKKLDDETLDLLEELLITADLGPKTSSSLIEALRAEKFDKEIDVEEVKQFLADEITKILEPISGKLNVPDTQDPYVILMVGVNGVGKTTTIGKLAKSYTGQGKSVLLAAGDTFRAAAVEQLKVWADRTGSGFAAKEIGSDAAALAFEALEKAGNNHIDIVFVDTAGRLQNKKNLMDELAKIKRVMQKKYDAAPHETILILDATTGQNALSQVENFKKIVDITGLVVTKLDGSAKGGVLVSLAQSFDIPVYAIGVGEQVADLQAFEPRDYAHSLLGISRD